MGTAADRHRRIRGPRARSGRGRPASIMLCRFAWYCVPRCFAGEHEREYLRVTPDELARAVKDPKSVVGLVEAFQDAQERTLLPPTQTRHLTTHQAWNAISFLLGRAGFPVDIVRGEGWLADDNDWRHGPPGYLTTEKVRVAAEALAATTYDELVSGITPTDLAQRHVYPGIWDEPYSLEWVRGWYEPLIPFFAAASAQGNAMLVWLD